MSRASELALTGWITEHLSVAVCPVIDPDSLADLERRVLEQLDPPLNLTRWQSTPRRARLSTLRSESESHPLKPGVRRSGVFARSNLHATQSTAGSAPCSTAVANHRTLVFR